MTPKIKYKLIKRSRSPYWLIRLDTPCPDGWQERSTKETRRREAERAAAHIVASIGEEDAKRTLWKTFRKDYEYYHLCKLKRPGCFKSAANKMEELIKVRYVEELNAAKLKQLRKKLESEGLKGPSVASYLKHIRAALGWAEENGYIQQAPRVKTGTTAEMKGRPITLEEYERLLTKVTKVVGSGRSKSFKRLLNGIWYTGLRLQESLDLDWSDPNTIHLMNLDGKHPMIAYPASSQKNAKVQMIPLVPEAVAFFRKTPKTKRKGKVFVVLGKSGKPIKSADYASRIISDIGLKSRIVTKTDEETGEKRHPTAHDIRRSFAQRMSRKLPEDILRELMRHADIKTTRAHYAEIEAEVLSERIQRALQ